VGVWAAAPALVQLEANVIRWFCEIVGYPSSARGILTSGGSLANFSGIVTARTALLPENFLQGTIYTSDQAHHSIEKAAGLAGFPAKNVRVVPCDAQFRVDVAEMQKMISRDRDAGMTPFMIVGHAGTTNTGAVDDLDALADLAGRERLWFHIDAAYGGFFMLTDHGRRVMAGLDRADSLVLDPHKGLFLPYGTGCLLVRDGEALRRAHSHTASYMPALQQDPDLVDFCELSPELSRGFRGLRVWLPLKMHGIEPFRRSLEEKLQLAQWAADNVRAIDGIEILAEPQLSVVAFRLVKPALDDASLNQLNSNLLRRINERKRVHLSGALLGPRFALRICVLSFRTHMERMQMAVDDIRTAVAES
jgi:aromatic-L-amino-acid decarboxylase